MTIPKTLAALPNNQYATVLLDVSGKLLAKDDLLRLVMFFPRLANDGVIWGDVMVLCERKAVRKGVWRRDRAGVRTGARLWTFASFTEHWRRGKM